MSTEDIVDIFKGIESRLDIIEDLLDELEDRDVDVRKFRDNLSELWNVLEDLTTNY